MGSSKDNSFTVTILGARGSIPVCRPGIEEFGGATSCYMVCAGSRAVFLDAGLGLTNTPEIPGKDISILLSHPHLDHLIGLPFFPPLSDNNRRIDFYAVCRDGLSAAQQLEGLFSPPYWPCSIGNYPAQFLCHDIRGSFNIGPLKIDTLEVRHPGGSTAFRLTYGERTLVYMSDYEQGDRVENEVKDFASDADLLLCDAQYTDEEFSIRTGFGHSTASKAIALKHITNVKRMLLVHHDPAHDDEFLRAAEKRIGDPSISYARNMEVISI